MGREYDLQSIFEKLQRPAGYQGCRIQPHHSLKSTWLAEMYTADHQRPRKSWKPLCSEQTNAVRTFASPEDAELALVETRGPFTDSRPFYVQLAIEVSEEQRWHELISCAERQTPESLEAMIEDASARLVAAMRELRGCRSQSRANRLHEIIIGQSNRLSYLARFTNQEAKRLQWLKVIRED
jgi:hypothetical protein